MQSGLTRLFRRAKLVVAAGSAVALAASCELIPDSDFPPGGGTEIAELPQYRLWWSLVEQCSLRRRRMDVKWYTTNGRLINYEGVLANGAFRSWPDRIALVFPARGPTARHEMLHALLQQGGHPLDKFAGDCDGFVNFFPPEEYGATEEEREAALSINADSVLDVSVTTVPSVPQVSLYGGNFVVIIKATNVSKRNVWISLRESIIARYTDSVGLRELSYIRGGDRVFFRAGQTRRVVLDAQIRATGNYVLNAQYGRAKAVPAKLQLER